MRPDGGLTLATSPPLPDSIQTPVGIAAIRLIVLRSLRRHALATSITVLAVALAAGLVMAVFAIQRQTRDAFVGGAGGFDAVLGAPGSPLQLVLNAVFHLETSPGNIPYDLYEQMRDHPLVEAAIPYAVGDSYRGFRIVGVHEDLFNIDLASNRKLAVRPGGRIFDPQRMEAVVGSFAAARAGLRVGSHFHPAHGVSAAAHDHDDEYVVVGILEPTNAPIDRVIWIPIEGIYRMSGHVLRGGGDEYVASPDEDIPDDQKEVSAVLLKFKSPDAGLVIEQELARDDAAVRLAWPIAAVVAELFDKLGWAARILELVAYLVILVAGGTILAGLYNTINERRREFAILRSLGARRATVFTAIILESSTIAAAGVALGFLIYGGILALSAAVIHRETGVVIDPWHFHPALLLTPIGLIALGALAGLLPALRAYATDVATHLAPHS